MTRLSANTLNTLKSVLPELQTHVNEEIEDISVEVRIEDVTVLPAATEARLKLRLTGEPRSSVSGSWFTRNGTGTNEGTHYVRASGKYVFQPGESIEQDIVIQLKGNNAPGRDVQVVLSATVQGGTNEKSIGRIYFSNTIPEGGVRSGFRLDWEHNFIDGFEATDSGFTAAGLPCWQSKPWHGRTQPGNKELGLYADPALYPETNPFPVIDGKRRLRSEYFPEGVRDINGMTTICPWRPIKDASGNTISYEPFYYTAAMITSRTFRHVEVGDRVEFRMAMPVLGERGFWPAGWLLPTDLKWPPEIDLIEMPIDHKADLWTYYTTQHWSTSSGSHLQLSYPIDIRTLGVTEDMSQPHTYGIEITKDELRFDFDGRKSRVMENRAPTKSWFLLLNMAFGGTWPGGPTADTTHPGDVILDWVRFYKPAS